MPNPNILSTYLIQQLETNAHIFSNLLSNKSPEEIKFKPKTEAWNLLEIICHLVDEETEDFRMRLKTVLETPGTFPPPIDPEGWPVSRNYLAQDFQEKLNSFIEERKISIEWLKSIDEIAWENYYQHVTLGPLSAKLFFTNWLAHDYLHIRQITRLNHQYLKKLSGENLTYAGTWNY